MILQNVRLSVRNVTVTVASTEGIIDRKRGGEMINLLNKKVRHFGALGVGTVIAQDDKYITIQFSNKVSKFGYPSAFEKVIVPEDEDMKIAIQEELEAIKAAEEAKKAEEAARKAAEEQARLDALKA